MYATTVAVILTRRKAQRIVVLFLDPMQILHNYWIYIVIEYRENHWTILILKEQII